MQINSFTFALTVILSSCISNTEADKYFAPAGPVVASELDPLPEPPQEGQAYDTGWPDPPNKGQKYYTSKPDLLPGPPKEGHKYYNSNKPDPSPKPPQEDQKYYTGEPLGYYPTYQTLDLVAQVINNTGAETNSAPAGPAVVAGKPDPVPYYNYTTYQTLVVDQVINNTEANGTDASEAKLPPYYGKGPYYYVEDYEYVEVPYYDENACPCFGPGVGPRDIKWGAFGIAPIIPFDIHRESSCNFEKTRVNFNYVFLDSARSYTGQPSFSTVINNVEYNHLTAMYDPGKENYECGEDDAMRGEITEAQAWACHELLNDTCNTLLENRICPCYSVEDLVAIESTIKEGYNDTCDEYGTQMLAGRQVRYIEGIRVGEEVVPVCMAHGSGTEQVLSDEQLFHCALLLEDSCSALGIEGGEVPDTEPEVVEKPDEIVECPCFDFGDLGWAFEKRLGMRADINRETSCNFEDKPQINIDYVFLRYYAEPIEAKSIAKPSPGGFFGDGEGEEVPVEEGEEGEDGAVYDNVEYTHLSALYDPDKNKYQCSRDDTIMPEDITKAQASACHELLANTCNNLENRLCPCYGVKDLLDIESSIEQGVSQVKPDRTCDAYGIEMLGDRNVHCIQEKGEPGERAVCKDISDIKHTVSADQEFHCNQILGGSCSVLGFKGEPIVACQGPPKKDPPPIVNKDPPPIVIDLPGTVIDPPVIDDLSSCPCFNQQRGLQWINDEKIGTMVDIDRSTSCTTTDSPTIKLNWVYLGEARSGDGEDVVDYTELAATYDPDSGNDACAHDMYYNSTLSAAQAEACYQDLKKACSYMEERVCPCYSVSDLVQIEHSVSEEKTVIDINTTCALKNKYGLFSNGTNIFGKLHETMIAGLNYNETDGTMSCFNTAANTPTGEESLNKDQEFHCHAMITDSCLAVQMLEDEEYYKTVYTPTDQKPEEKDPVIYYTSSYNEETPSSTPTDKKPGSNQKPSEEHPMVNLTDREDTASDVPGFPCERNKMRSCEWAAKNRGNRCKKICKNSGKSISDFCGMSCPPGSFNSSPKEDKACSPQPMDDSEESSGLFNDIHFHEDGKIVRDCAWVSKNPCRRCNREDSLTLKRAHEFCGMACRGIVVDPVNPNSSTESLVDNPHFHKDGKGRRNCRWVSEKPDRRCRKKDRLTNKPCSEFCLKSCKDIESIQDE